MRLRHLLKASLHAKAEAHRVMLSPELQLLLACGHVKPSVQDQLAQKDLIKAGIEWDKFLTLAHRHNVVPAVWNNLKSLADLEIPRAALSELKQAYEDNSRYVLDQASALSDLLKLLASQGIRCMVLKGLPVALQVYGDPTLRQAGDLDLLVDEAMLPRVQQILRHTEYRVETSEMLLTPLQQHMHQVFLTHHVVYFHQSRQIALEVHWRLFTNPHLMPFDPFEEARQQAFGSAEFLSLRDEDLFVYLCVHGDFSMWSRLKWQFDLPQFLAARPGLVWDTVLRRAESLGVSRSVHLGLYLAYRLYGARLPKELIRKIEADPSVHGRFEMVCNILMMDKPLFDRPSVGDIATGFRYLVHMRRGIRYQVHLWCSMWLSFNDWEMLRLPDGLFPLYIVLRPFLVTARRVYRRLTGARP